MKIRVMPSAPDTISSGNGIAATYPSDNEKLKELLTILKLYEVSLTQEKDIHAFTALGLCLPIALTYWDSLGKEFDESSYERLAEKYALSNSRKMIAWARSVQQKDLGEKALQSYLKQAATPGGITEAVINAISDGKPLHAALKKGLQRSRSLAEQ